MGRRSLKTRKRAPRKLEMRVYLEGFPFGTYKKVDGSIGRKAQMKNFYVYSKIGIFDWNVEVSNSFSPSSIPITRSHNEKKNFASILIYCGRSEWKSHCVVCFWNGTKAATKRHDRNVELLVKIVSQLDGNSISIFGNGSTRGADFRAIYSLAFSTFVIFPFEILLWNRSVDSCHRQKYDAQTAQ